VTTASHIVNDAPTPVRTAASADTPAVVPATSAQLRRLRWAVRASLTLGVAASVAANILHARPNPISQLIAAWPPLALLLTVELISRVPTYRRCLGVIRLAATAGIAGIAAWVSYSHMVGVAARYGETEAAASYLLPLSVDGLVIVASVSLVEITGRLRADHDQHAPAPMPTIVTAAAAGTPAQNTSAAPAGVAEARGIAVGASRSKGSVGGSETHPVRHAALADRVGRVAVDTVPAPPGSTVTVPAGSVIPDEPPSPEPQSPAGPLPAIEDRMNWTRRRNAAAQPAAGSPDRGAPSAPAAGPDDDESSRGSVQPGAAESAARPAGGKADEPAQVSTATVGAQDDEVVPSGTAAAVAYWYRRDPGMHPAEIGARINRSERTVRRYWPPATQNGVRVNGNPAHDLANTPLGR
jgi:hypothetical protein